MSQYEITIPKTEYDPDLCTKTKDGPVPAELPFVWFWHCMLSDPAWDRDNDEEKLEASAALRGRVSFKPEESIGKTFKISGDEKKHVLDVLAKMDLAPHFRQLVRNYRLAVLRAKQV